VDELGMDREEDILPVLTSLSMCSYALCEEGYSTPQLSSVNRAPNLEGAGVNRKDELLGVGVGKWHSPIREQLPPMHALPT
jgi:hypothetical protein